MVIPLHAQKAREAGDTIVNQSFTGIYVVALDTTFAWVNPRFAELLGYRQEDLIGHSFLEFVLASDVPRRREKFNRMAGGTVESAQVIGSFVRKDGSELELLSQSTLGTFEGKTAIIGLGFDITEQRYNQRELVRLNGELHDAEERSRRQAERLAAFWRIVNNPSLADSELWHAMIEQAAAAIRPGQPYVGGLGRIEDADIIYEAVAATAEYVALRGGAGDFAQYKRLPLAGSAAEALLESSETTRWWDDIRTAFPGTAFERVAMECGIFTQFRAGGSDYVLWFVSPVATGAWSDEDRVYVEVLASFFQKQIQERWQSDRLLHLQTHDVLTGVMNRSQFRSQARMAAMNDETFAVVTLDMNGFGEVNETYGNQIGDALLVEVAAAVCQRIEPGEIIGRLWGDVFAVYIPRPKSREHVFERAARFIERFREPFSTGDRDGKEFIALSASIGIAIAPEHGGSVDGIISHASVAVSAAKARGPGTTLFYDSRMDAGAK